MKPQEKNTPGEKKSSEQRNKNYTKKTKEKREGKKRKNVQIERDDAT